MDGLYQSQHLLLLVGGNPLPNAVAGRLLVVPGGTIALIHSRDTADVANRLKTWLLNERELAQVSLKQIEESNPTSIISGVQGHLKGLQGHRVGLNYTGGTKAMSVHAYRAVEQWAKEKGITPIFSYLDARTLQIVFDTVDTSGNEQRKYVGRAMKLELTDLLALHGWKLHHEPTKQPILPRTAQELAVVQAQEAAAAAWGQWLQEELFEKAMRRQKIPVTCPRSPDGQECTVEQPIRRWLSKTQLQQTTLQWPSHPALQTVTEELQRELILPDSLRLGDAAKTCGYRDLQDFCKWLDGLWLESAAFEALQDCTTACGLDDVSMNLEPASGGDSPANFEFDVMAMRGYQLFALSCSTDTENIQGGKDRLKKKLFEAYIRARQLGGDEARVALVSCSNDPEGLEHEMQRDVDPEGRIRVFGRRQLADLGTHLRQWIQSQSGEE